MIINNRMPSNEVDYSGDPWYRVLHECTLCLREQNAEGADACLEFLGLLEMKLKREGIYDDDDGVDSFPGIDADSDSDSGSDNVIGAVEEEEDDHRLPTNNPPSWSVFCRNPNGLHHAVQQGLDARPRPVGRTKAGNPRLPGKRLFTRIFTSRSEIFVLKANHAARFDRDWGAAGEFYQMAIHQIHRALGVTDTAISRWWSHQELPQQQQQSYRQQQRLHQQLIQDASIVEVALLSMTDHRNKLVAAGKREEAKLLRKLQPQWASRDEVKERMGAERWRNNPRPKFDYARMRAELEAQLKSLQTAMESLEGLELGEALQKASGLREQLLGNKSQNNGHNNSNNRHDGTTERPRDKQQIQSLLDQKNDQQRQKHRYNNTRPSPALLQQRVSLLDYPDPVDLGWKFTGSWEAVEFFERTVNEKLVKLDWYFTTGTVKTSLDHPTQGRTQLFAKQCDPSLYAKVLTNPRTHTGKRYQRKPNRNNRSG